MKRHTIRYNNILCFELTEDCYLRTCQDCRHKADLVKDELESIFDSLQSSVVTWEQWKTTDRCEVLTFSDTPQEFCKKFMEKLLEYSVHFLIDKKQTKAFESLKKDLPIDTALIVGDYSMNYSFEELQNVTACHWKKNQCSLYTAMIYMNIGGLRKQQSVVIIREAFNNK